jgi:nitrite reductase/ring-hydroxylating ferredoxin subunit
MRWQDHRYVPPTGALLCQSDAVFDEKCKELRYGEGDAAFTMLLYRQGDDIRAYLNKCPHFSLPLNAKPDEFLMLGDGKVMCAYHCAIFRLNDGHCIDGPARGMGLDPIPIEIKDGQIFMGAK